MDAILHYFLAIKYIPSLGCIETKLLFKRHMNCFAEYPVFCSVHTHCFRNQLTVLTAPRKLCLTISLLVLDSPLLLPFEHPAASFCRLCQDHTSEENDISLDISNCEQQAGVEHTLYSNLIRCCRDLNCKNCSDCFPPIMT